MRLCDEIGLRGRGQPRESLRMGAALCTCGWNSTCRSTALSSSSRCSRIARACLAACITTIARERGPASPRFNRSLQCFGTCHETSTPHCENVLRKSEARPRNHEPCERPLYVALQDRDLLVANCCGYHQVLKTASLLKCAPVPGTCSRL